MRICVIYVHTHTHIYIYIYICVCVFPVFFDNTVCLLSLCEIPGFKWGFHGQVHIQPQRGPCPRFGGRCRDEWCHGLAKQHAFEFESVNMELQQFKKKHRLLKCNLCFCFSLSLSLCQYNIKKIVDQSCAAPFTQAALRASGAPNRCVRIGCHPGKGWGNPWNIIYKLWVFRIFITVAYWKVS